LQTDGTLITQAILIQDAPSLDTYTNPNRPYGLVYQQSPIGWGIVDPSRNPYIKSIGTIKL